MGIYLFLFLISVCTILYLSFHLAYILLKVVIFFDSEHENIDPRELKDVLNRKNKFYNQLSSSKKEKFERRVLHFIDDMDFEGRQGFKVTHEMMILISAAAIQLTFGLKKYRFKNYITILVYPDEFYSRSIGRNVKGGVAEDKIIALSWPDFEKGFAIGDDNYNLGLHEMTHALKCEALLAGYTTIKFRSKLRNWLKKAEHRIEQIKKDDANYLRKYGTTNTDEFFSVCVEYFFESPQIFKTKYPDLYFDLCYVLNLDPENISGDYAFNRKTSFYRPLNEFYTLFHFEDLNGEWIRVSIITLAVCITIFTISLNYILIADTDILLLFSLIFFLISVFFPFFKKRGFRIPYFGLINLSLFTPVIFTSLILLNFIPLGKNTEVISSHVKLQEELQAKSDKSITVSYDNKKLQQCLGANIFIFETEAIVTSDSVAIHYKKGLIGLPIIEATEFFTLRTINGSKAVFRHYRN